MSTHDHASLVFDVHTINVEPERCVQRRLRVSHLRARRPLHRQADNCAVQFVSKTSNWHCTQVTSPATEVPGSHIVGSFDLTFTGEMQGKAHCTLVMTAYGKQLANGHKPNDFGESAGRLGGSWAPSHHHDTSMTIEFPRQGVVGYCSGQARAWGKASGHAVPTTSHALQSIRAAHSWPPNLR